MKRILLSWYAYSHDFVWTGEGKHRKRIREISEDSPTFLLHKFHWEKYDEHVLLNANTKENDIRFFDFLRSELVKEFKDHKVVPRTIPIADVIELTEIVPQIQKLFTEYSDCNIDVFISPGTPSMQSAWLLAAINFKKNISLFQLRPREYSKNTSRPDKVIIDLDSSIFPTNINIAHHLVTEKQFPNQPKITPSLKPIFEKGLQVASIDDASCLILGDNGTGKEMLARYIHENSSRRDKPFKAINCAAYTDELLPSELFGHKKGAFTGAVDYKIGIFESAESGTIFLDEIGDISAKMQVSLLRVLQEREILPVGSNDVKKINVRVICATNKNLVTECEKGKFRWDLYYRIKIAPLKLPALRERGQAEMKEWIKYFIDKHAKKFPTVKQKFQISKEAQDVLLNYAFPGNVRELENMIIGLYTFYSGEITVKDLDEEITKPKFELSVKLADVERQHIIQVFSSCDKNISHAMEKLDISRNTLKSKLKEYGLLASND